MNSFVVSEALTTGFKEAFKFGVVWLVFSSYLLVRDRKIFLKPFAAGLVSSFLLALSLLLIPKETIPREYVGNAISMSFAIFLLSSVAALLNASGITLLKLPKGSGKTDGLLIGIVFFATVFFFLPDNAGAIIFLKELSLLKEKFFLTYSSAITGFLAAGLLFWGIAKYVRPRFIGGFFDLPQLLLFLAIIKLFGSGTKGLSELSLIPTVQRGLMKFSHDFIHQTFVLLMVPDHPILKVTTWNFIGILFGPNIASFEALCILLFAPLLFLYYSLLRPLPEPGGQTGAERRKVKYELLSGRRKKGLPVIGFVCIILIAWFSQGGESVSRLYIPKPKPVVEDKGIVMIPVNDPTMDLRDGALHKFSLHYQGQDIRILVIKKENNVLSVCLDACEICPPDDGYGQREDLVVCLYCNTPIPVNTLGEPGGCNPIPLTVAIDDRFIRLELAELLKKWEYVKTGKSKEALK